jgi:hypothetical protein
MPLVSGATLIKEFEKPAFQSPLTLTEGVVGAQAGCVSRWRSGGCTTTASHGPLVFYLFFIIPRPPKKSLGKFNLIG